MKIDSENIFVAQGDFKDCEEYKIICQELRDAINAVSWYDPNKFIIKPDRKANGVVPIKKNFVQYLLAKGWIAEQKMSVVDGIQPGPIDVIKITPRGIFAVEWETGNVSSSHRALNKIAVGIIQKAIIGGILILPKKNLAQYLTDRIGNYEEIAPYEPLYRNVIVENGLMGVFAIDYDGISNLAPLIPKGNDGNAKK